MLVTGPTVFRLYMRDPEAAREGFHQGRMRTRDVLRIDRDEFLYLTGRKKELVKYKGDVYQLYGGYAR
jgi:4-coumarate--CoA ligase